MFRAFTFAVLLLKYCFPIYWWSVRKILHLRYFLQ